MDEGRKRVLLIASAILAARKLAQYDGGKRVPATVAAISDAVRRAEANMKAIDQPRPPVPYLRMLICSRRTASRRDAAPWRTSWRTPEW
jgi:hypothetical protein